MRRRRHEKLRQLRRIICRQLADEVFANVSRRSVIHFADAFQELDSLGEELLTGAAIGEKQQAVSYEMSMHMPVMWSP